MEPGKAKYLSYGWSIAFGALTAGLGLLIDLYVYAFASMVDPTLRGRDYWSAVLRGMFLSGAVIPTLLGLILAIAGAWMAIASAGAGLYKARRPIIATWRVFLISIAALLAVGVIIFLLL